MLVNIDSSGFFSDNLIYLRKKYCLTRRSLAKLTGINEYTLKGIEDGTLPKVLNHVQLKRICQVLDVKLEVLLDSALSDDPEHS